MAPTARILCVDYRYYVGVAMESAMIRAGLMARHDAESETTTERIIRQSIRSLSKVPMNGVEQTINDNTFREFKKAPINEDYITTSMNVMVSEAKKLRISRETAIEEMNKSFLKLENLINDPEKTRSDSKAPIQIPLILPNLTQATDKMSQVHMIRSGSLDPVIDKIWRHAYNYSLAHSENFEREDLDVRYQRALMGDTSEKDLTARGTWHRVEIILEPAEEQHLSKDGYHGKKYKDQEFSHIRRQTQQRSFSLQSPTDDIVQALSLTPQPIDFENPYYQRLIPLISQAEKMSGNSSECSNVIKSLFDTNLVTALCVISAIGQELAVSLKQHVDRKTWILKKLLDFDVELLVSPTNSESHIFFLIRYRGTVLNQGAFRQVTYYDGWWYTDLLSINSSRLDNLIKAPCIYVNSLLHFRIGASRMAKSDLDCMSPSLYAEHMAMLTTMIALEDKAQTEDMALNVRYMVMQFIKGDDELSWPDLGAIVEKIPTIMRSRLAVYLYKQIRTYCLLQWEALPQRLPVDIKDPDHSPDQFQDLLCPFTHQELTTFYDVVQTIYIAYSKNKNSSPEQNCDFAMIEKIAAFVLNVKEEKQEIYKGLEDPTPGEYPGSHEFSRSFLKQACQLLKIRFKTQLGEEWMSTTENQIIKELVRSTHHEAVATMKASADFDQGGARMFERLEKLEEEGFHKLNSTQVTAANILLQLHRTTGYTQMTEEQWEEFRNVLAVSNLNQKGVTSKARFKRVVKSCKCHEAVIKELSNDPELQPLLISDYSSIFRAVMEETKGICCYLFKKQQHGGLREIYVLTFRSRLLQLLPEVCARVLCSLCPEEVLTHPSKKTYGYEQHNINVMKLGGHVHSDTILHRTSSEDKSKWSQGMNVTAFSLILSELLPEYLAKACMRVFHAFRNKRVLLPEGVMNMFLRDVELDNKKYEKLKKLFWGGEQSKYFDIIKGQTFFKTPTGMWQGILHYNSSLLHVLQSVHYKNMAKLVFANVDKVVRERNDIGIGSLVLDTVVSSDDSATYGTIVLPIGYRADTVKVADETLDLIMKLNSTHSRFFMMIESPKSCISSRTVGEFNSIFVCSKTYISPAIKKVLASVSIPEAEDLESRQIMLANMHKDILEEGCPFYQVQLHSLCNAVMHYMAFGLFINPLFSTWARSLVKNPDPHLGFLLLDVDEMSGLLGYNFIKYNSLRATDVAVMPTSSGLVKSGFEGEINTGVVVTQGDRRRWEQFKDRVVWPGWREYIEAHPDTLYMEKGITREEIQARLGAKACSKGVHESLKAGVSDSRALAASVYVLDHPVVTVRSLASMGAVKKEITPKIEKKTLIALTETPVPDTMMTHKAMNSELRDILYPNHRFYEACLELLMEMRGAVLVSAVRHRKARTRVEVRIGSNSLTLPIMTVLRWKWLSTEQKHATFTLEESWALYSKIFTWLKPTLDETLAASPFSEHIALHSFLSTIEKKSSIVSILCKKINTDNPLEQVSELLKFNYYPELMRARAPDSIMTREEPGKIPKHSLHRLSLVSGALTMALHSPTTGDVTDLIQDMASSVEITEEELVQLSLSQKYARQAAIFSVATGKSLETTKRILLNSGKGVIKQYMVPQRRTADGNWVGRGRLLIQTKYSYLEILVVDEYVIAIKCSTLEGLNRDFAVVSEHLLADGFEFNLNESVKTHASIHFPDVTNGVITDWVATRRGLVRTSMPRPTRDKRGLIRVEKRVATTEVFNPVVIVEARMAQAEISDSLTVIKDLKNDCPFLQVVGVMHNSDRKSPLLRYYGPRRPLPINNLETLAEREIDTESVMDCWMVNQPIDSAAGLKLLQYVVNSNEQEDFDHVIEGTHHETLTVFVSRSFKWRAMSTYKVKSSDLHYSSELPEGDCNPPIITRMMKEDVNRIMRQILDDLVPLDINEDAAPAAPEILEPFDWAAEVEEGELLQLGAGSVEPEDVGEDQESPESSEGATTMNTEYIDAPLVDLQMAPGLYMVHKFWDDVIANLDRRGVWDSINKGFRLSRRNQEMVKLIRKVLSLPPVENDDDELSD